MRTARLIEDSFKTPLPGGGEGQLQSRRRLKQGEGGRCTRKQPSPQSSPRGRESFETSSNGDNASRCPRGYTLIELVVSMTAATLLMTGLASALLIASSAFQMDSGSQADKGTAAEIQADLTADLQHALSFSERTAHAVTFTVPDRDGDTFPETIRYAWSGTHGDPLTYAYNGGTAVTLVGDVHKFDLTYLTRLMKPDSVDLRILFVTKDPGVLNAKEQLRVDLLLSWDYTVNLVDDDASQAIFNSAFLTNHVAYVNVEIDPNRLSTKLLDAPIGVVNEEFDAREELGLAQNRVDQTVQDINIVDNTHYITESFSTGTLQIFTSSQDVRSLKATLAGGLQSLGEYLDGSTWRPALATLDTGADRYGGGTSTSRRVQLPWGKGAFDFNSLNSDGQTIMNRALQWANTAVLSPTFRFGYDTILATATKKKKYQIATQVVLSEDGTLNSISAYMKKNKDARFAIYTDVAGEPGSLILQTDVFVTATGPEWNTVSVTDTPLTTGTYWLALAYVDKGHEHYREDTGGQTRYRNNDAVANGFLATWGTSDEVHTHKISIYATYTP